MTDTLLLPYLFDEWDKPFDWMRILARLRTVESRGGKLSRARLREGAEILMAQDWYYWSIWVRERLDR